MFECEDQGYDCRKKCLNVKTKAMTVEKITDNKEQNELTDLRQQIESLTTIMKSVTIGKVKPKVVEGVSSPRKKERSTWKFSLKGFQGSPKKGKDL